MVDNKSCLKYKYLTLKVKAELNSADAMYKWTYTVTGIDTFEGINVLGFYDEKQTAPVILMSNKNIYEYDWTAIPARIRTGTCSNYMDMFKDDKHIIIVSDAITFAVGGAGTTVDESGFKVSNAFEGYTIQYIHTTVYSTIENENLLAPTITEDERRRKQEEKRDKEWKKRYGQLPEESRPTIAFVEEIKEAEKETKPPFYKRHKGLLQLAAVFLLFIGIVTASIISSNAIGRFEEWLYARNSPVKSTAVKTTITKNPYSRAQAMAIAIDSMSVFEDGTKDSIDVKALADSIYAVDLERRADSVAREVIKHDSLVSTLPKNKRVQIELVAVIEDGITTRKVQTDVVLDTIRESDMKHLTKTITAMATNMAKDRQTEIDTSRTYYRVSKAKTESFISME
jgi:hypothetical protein